MAVALAVWPCGPDPHPQEMGDPSSTAQVHPHKLTTALVAASGAKVLHGAAEGVLTKPLQQEAGGAGAGGGARAARKVTGKLGYCGVWQLRATALL